LITLKGLLYGTNPLFIFDPADTANQPVRGILTTYQFLITGQMR